MSSKKRSAKQAAASRALSATGVTASRVRSANKAPTTRSRSAKKAREPKSSHGSLGGILAPVVARYKELVKDATDKMPEHNATDPLTGKVTKVKSHVTQELCDKLFGQAMDENPGLVEKAINDFQAKLTAPHVSKPVKGWKAPTPTPAPKYVPAADEGV